MLDGEDWKRLDIKDPSGQTIFSVAGQQGFRELGMTELFFEGAEPSLSEVPLAQLLARFPEGEYDFTGRTVDGELIESDAIFTHAVPAGPLVSTQVGPKHRLVISWSPVIATAAGFPVRPLVIKGYQVLVGSFQVTLPASATSVICESRSSSERNWRRASGSSSAMTVRIGSDINRFLAWDAQTHRRMATPHEQFEREALLPVKVNQSAARDIETYA